MKSAKNSDKTKTFTFFILFDFLPMVSEEHVKSECPEKSTDYVNDDFLCVVCYCTYKGIPNLLKHLEAQHHRFQAKQSECSHSIDFTGQPYVYCQKCGVRFGACVD